MDENHEQEQQDKDIIEDTPKKNQYLFFIKTYQKYIFIIGIILLISFYAFGCFYYHNKFMPRTTINGIQVSGLTDHGALKQLEKKIPRQTLTLEFIDYQKETINQEECGISFNPNSDIQKELRKQNHWLWFTHWFYQDQLQVDNLLIVDEDKMKKTLLQLKHLQADQQIAPVDAKVEYKDKQFQVVQAKPGSKIQMDRFVKAILLAFGENKTTLNVKDEDCYEKPQILDNDQRLQNLKTAAEKYCQAEITYQTTTGHVVLDGNTLMKWLSIDESGNYYQDDDEFHKQATLYVKELAKKINIIGKEKTFVGANNRKLHVSGGNYGYKLNQTKEVEGLLKDIKTQKKGIRVPITTGIQASYENGGLGDTFIEIDMTKQHFWYHKNGQIVLENDVVTGLPSDPHKITPEGTYYIYFMQRNRTLRGEIQEDGKPEYETPVDYWMAFNGGIGLHDATWQTKFGGNVYYTRGSHGCINLPLKVAGKLYDMIKVNTPVVCYY